MKKIFSLLLLGFTLASTVAIAQSPSPAPSMTANGSTSNLNYSCSNLQNFTVQFTAGTYEENRPFGVTYRYVVELVRNGSVIDSREYKTGDFEVYCPNFCPDLQCSFDVAPLAGYYYCQYKVRKVIGGVGQNNLLYNGQTNTINVTRPDTGTYGVCQGTDGDYAFNPVCSQNTTIIVEAGTQYYVVQKEAGLIYKFSGLGSTGDNMFAINGSTPPSNLPGYNHLIGSQDFDAGITDILYTSDQKTIISFDDGKILKINGTGGSGANMFQVTEGTNSFTTIGSATHFSGSYKCLSKVNDLMFRDNLLFVACENGNMLKVNGTGGTGTNMFLVTENAATGFAPSGIPFYYSGSAKFSSAVLEIYPAGSQLFIATENKKLLKVNGNGGTGANMFGITENASGFASSGTGTSYVGHMLFQTAVSKVYNNGTFTFIGLESGKLLKINGTGGTGTNMFAVTETSTAFVNVAGYNYYSGNMRYNARVVAMTHNPAGTVLFIAFANGKMMKVQNSGSTGYDMFNATENASGFSRTSTAYSNQLIGSSFFRANTTDIKFFGTTQILCLQNNKMLKINGDGSTGTNMYAVAQLTNAFRPLLGYSQNLIGSQLLPCQYAYGRPGDEETTVQQAITSEEQLGFSEKIDRKIEMNLFPNPFSSDLTIDLPAELRNENTIVEMYSVSGILVQSFNGRNARNVNTETIKSGVYIVNIKVDGAVVGTVKAVKQ